MPTPWKSDRPASNSHTTRRRTVQRRAAVAVATLMLLTVVAPALGAATAGAGEVTAQGATLTATQIGWGVVGLDSNNVNAGPNLFPVGARVCNTGDAVANNVQATWVWDTSNANVNLSGPSTITQASVAAGACRDFYFSVQVTRTAAAYDTTRRFHIDATSDDAATVSTPTPREIYVERLVSQNRNAITSIVGLASTVYVGDTVTFTLNGRTATNGYEQLAVTPRLDAAIFDVTNVTATYNVPSGATNDQFYADACGWNPVVGAGTYRSCVGPANYGSGKVGGSPIAVTVTAKIVGTGTTSVSGVLYDFSGSSYHYNSDYPTFMFSVTAVAPDPASVTATDDSTKVVQDSNVTIPVTDNDTATNTTIDLSTVAVNTGPTHGNAVVTPGGDITYTPDPGWTGTDTFTYDVCNGSGVCDTATVTVDTLLVVARPDVDDTAVDTPVTIAVLANDEAYATTIDKTQVTLTTNGAHGNAVYDATSGTFTYTPDAGWTGVDTFTYTVCDTGLSACDTTTVFVTVHGVTATDDSDTTWMDTPVQIDVIANDTFSGANYDPASVTVTSGPAHGTATFDAATGSFTYTPDAGWTGTDTFTYQVCDDLGVCDTATVTVTVDPTSVTANGDNAKTAKDTPVDITPLDNDTASGGAVDPSCSGIDTQPTHGTVTYDNTTGTYTYTPDAGYTGPDSFTYTACDSNGNTDIGTVTLVVTEIAATDDTATTPVDTPVEVDAVANDTLNGSAIDPACTAVATQPTHGSATWDSTAQTFTYTPDAGYTGSDSFTYTLCNLAGDTDTATVNITVTVATDVTATTDTASTSKDTPVDITPFTNDSTTGGTTIDPACSGIATQPAHGTVTYDSSTGTYTYTPDAGYTGADSFTYTVCDSAGNTDTGTVNLLVTEIVATDDDAIADKDTPLEIDAISNDTLNGSPIDPACTAVATQPSHGSATWDATAQTFTYTPDAGYTGPDSFTYTLCNLAGDTDTATVNIAVTDLDAVDDTATTPAGTPVVIDVTANDSATGGIDPACTEMGTQPAHGTATYDPATGKITYTPTAGYIGPDTFTYFSCDTQGVQAEATVNVNVTSAPTTTVPPTTTPAPTTTAPGPTTTAPGPTTTAARSSATTAATPAAASNLPRTGGNAGPLALAGGLLLAAGVALSIAARRRTR